MSKLYSKALRKFLIGQEEVTEKDVDGFDDLVKKGYIKVEEAEKTIRKKRAKKETEEAE